MSINPAEIELTEGQRRYVATRAERTGTPWPEFLHGLIPEEPESENGPSVSAPANNEQIVERFRKYRGMLSGVSIAEIVEARHKGLP
jgi:hypothetical protein